MYATTSNLLLTFTFPHFKILISSGPKVFTSFNFTSNSEDLAVILSKPIKIA